MKTVFLGKLKSYKGLTGTIEFETRTNRLMGYIEKVPENCIYSGKDIKSLYKNFCREVENRMGTIIVVEEIEKLGEILKKYDEIISGLGNAIKSNNTLFCKKLDAIVDEMFGEENK